MSAVHVSVQWLPDEIHMQPVGDFDLRTAHLLAEALELVCGPRPVLVDCAGIAFLGVAGARVLLVAQDELEGAGGELVLVRPRAIVERVLHAVRPSRVPATRPCAPLGREKSTTAVELVDTTMTGGTTVIERSNRCAGAAPGRTAAPVGAEAPPRAALRAPRTGDTPSPTATRPPLPNHRR